MLQEKCIKPRPFQKIYLTGSVENKMLILCDCLDILGDINNLRLNFYNGACGYLKLNNIDSTLKRTYSFNDDKLIITIILMENLLIFNTIKFISYFEVLF